MALENVFVKCDRCGRLVDGLRGEYATAGFYDTGEGWWGRYAKANENVVCDACMWADPQYRADYGIHDAPISVEMLEVDAISREIYGDQG